jgi:hypothetical protein
MRTIATLATILSLAAFAACGPNNRNGDDDGTNDGGTGSNGDGSTLGNGDGGGSNGCSVASQFVYVVDEDNTLSKFDPPTMTFTDLGQLNCSQSAMPFSMGVDRNAQAYVLYDDGTLYSVPGLSTGNLACTQTSWHSTGSLTQFGMGFSTTTVGGSTDELFIAGGDAVDTSNTASQPATLASVDVSSFAATSVGNITGWPELTGTSNADLWGFFPDETSPRIDKINKAGGGAALTTYSLKALKGDPAAWAFAAYGGDLWVVLALSDGIGGANSTIVYQIGGETDAAPGSVKGMTPTNSRTIVGAGVSTCAPIVIN